MKDRIILNYKIEKLIGTGGMGSVYLASNQNIEQKVAIKVLNAELTQSSLIRQKFKEEAKMLCSLDHPNIVKFLNFVENDEGIFLVMEYVDGITLENFIMEKNGLIVEERIYELFDQILSGVAYAHKRGIVHRDIKPANIILSPDSEGEMQVKILDFGIAKIVSESNENEHGWVVGTPSYMSPEQITGKNIDQRSDIYSLGVLLHQMLTGKTPYDTTTLSDLKIKDMVLNTPLPRMKEYYGYISEKMQRIVDIAVDKDPKKRFQNCNEFKSVLKKALKPDPLPTKLKYTAVVLVLVILGLGFWYWDFNRLKVRYYKDYVEQWGVPQGIGKLTNSEASHSHRHYKFEYRKYKLLRISHVNSLNKIISDGESERYERPLDMKLFYGDNGKISFSKILDHNGKVLYKKSYNDKLNTVIFQYDDNYSTEKILSSQTIGYVNSFDENDEGKGKISRWLIEYDKNGYVSKIQYAGFQNILVGDSHGIYGRKYLRDDKGRVIEEHYLGKDGNPKATKWGLGIKKYYFDTFDNWVQSDYLTVEGLPCYDDSDGISVYKMEYDQYGNVILALNCESDGSLMLPKKNHIAGIKYEYDEKGFILKAVFIGTDNNPCYSPTTGYVGYFSQCDKNGFFNKLTFIDENNEIIPTSDGYAILKMVNDEKGNLIEQWYYDENENLVESSGGYAGFMAKLDSLGNYIEFITYDTNNQPCLQSDETIGYRAEYNEFSKRIKLTNLGEDLLPSKNNNGIATWVKEFDKRGNQIKISFYDESGEKLILSNENIAGWNSTYDENGNEIERSFFDTENKPCLINAGYSKFTSKFDEQGNEIERLYYEVDGNLVIIDEGYAGIKYQYDDRGNIIEYFPVAPNGKLAPGNLIGRYKYDKFDNQIESAVFGAANTPVLNGENWHRKTSIFNNRNQIIEIRYFNSNNKPTSFRQDKYSIERYNYDNRGNRIETLYFNTEDILCLCNEGWAYSTSEFDMMNRVIKQSFYDTNRKPTNPSIMVPEGFVKYDKWGNIIYLAAGDGKGNIINNPQKGWAIMEAEYNIKGNQTMVSYFDFNHKPCKLKDEDYWKLETTYDKRGHSIEQRYYDTSGNLRNTSYAYYRNKFDNAGNRTEEAWFDKNDKPCNNNWGYQKVVYEYQDKKPKTATVYKANGSVNGTFRFVNNKWESEDSNVKPNTSDGNWQAIWQNEKQNCPHEMSDGIIILSINITSNSCIITMKYSEISKYNISGERFEELKQEINQYAKTFKSYSQMPKNTSLILIMTDKANREVYRVSA